VGEPRRRYLWILAREPRMDYHLFEELKAIARRMGYDLAPLLVSRQRMD
jgi:apolipoprotein D and lipocalin family protein